MTDTTNTPATRSTRKIAGHAITLTVGRRYLATRPMADGYATRFDVSITDTTDGVIFDKTPAVKVKGLSYDRANDLLNEFNGEETWSGREWE
jgi:hypothetical protein